MPQPVTVRLPLETSRARRESFANDDMTGMSSYHLVLCACILVTSAVPPPSTREYGSWDEYDRDARRTRADGGRVMPLVRDARTNTSSTLPLFVVIGAQKCGTTFLRTSLAQHPLLTPARGYRLRCGGEVHYFDYRAGTVAKDAAAALADEAARGLGADKLRRARAKAVRQKYARDHCSLPGCNARAQFVFDTTPRCEARRRERERAATPRARLSRSAVARPRARATPAQVHGALEREDRAHARRAARRAPRRARARPGLALPLRARDGGVQALGGRARPAVLRPPRVPPAGRHAPLPRARRAAGPQRIGRARRERARTRDAGEARALPRAVFGAPASIPRGTEPARAPARAARRSGFESAPRSSSGTP